jgi:hypothetical protein
MLGPGSYVYDQTRLFEKPLTTEQKVVIAAALTLVSGPLAIMRGAGMGVSAARFLLLAFMLPSSPGGGGPGHSLTSTNPPPSVEEVGRMITGKSGSGKRCPTGMVWSPTHKKCILDITWGTDQYTRKSK